jgi:hypothetical protein
MGKTNSDVNEVELNYLNCRDEHNKFKGLIKFPTVYCVKFANVLCQDEEMVKKYLSEYYNPEFEQWEIINSLQQFKRDILSKRTNIGEYKDKIKNCIEIENYKWLWVLLKEFFLEHIEKEQMDNIVELIHNGVNINDIIKWYEKDRKILAITTFGVDYIKSVTSS